MGVSPSRPTQRDIVRASHGEMPVLCLAGAGVVTVSINALSLIISRRPRRELICGLLIAMPGPSCAICSRSMADTVFPLSSF